MFPHPTNNTKDSQKITGNGWYCHMWIMASSISLITNRTFMAPCLHINACLQSNADSSINLEEDNVADDKMVCPINLDPLDNEPLLEHEDTVEHDMAEEGIPIL